MISVNRNFGSLVGQLSLKTANNAVETAVERLSSGARVNSAADDSAGFAVDGSGNIQSKSSYDVDFDNGQKIFDMDVVYTHSDSDDIHRQTKYWFDK